MRNIMGDGYTPLHAEADASPDLERVKDLDERDIDDLNLDPEVDLPTRGTPPPPAGPKRQFNEGADDDTMFDDVDDFQMRVNLESPFSSSTALNKLPSTGAGTTRRRRLSLMQQSKFISYCDARLMDIQRKFVQSRGLNTQNGYTGLSPLLKDLKALTDFIWFSIENVPNTEYLLNQNLEEIDQSQYSIDKSTDFGQTSYLLKISDDLVDYVEKFELKALSQDEQHSIISKVFKLLFILDKVFARFLDGTIPGRTKMSRTDSVRLCGIAERTRVRMPWFLEQQDIHGYPMEVSKIYEESLDRCTSR